MKRISQIARSIGFRNSLPTSETDTRLQNSSGEEAISARRLLVSVGLCLALVFPGSLRSNPSQGTVHHGSVTFDDTRDGTLRILQASDKAILDWRNFSIAESEITEFVQPKQTSAALNRVSGGQASQIDGQLLANGQVFLLNPAGVVISATGRIDAAGFVASTLDVSDADFLAGGDLNFRGSSTAAIVNLGTIGAAEGDIFLIANRVENAGALEAPDGTVGLAAGNDVLLTTSGSERIFVRGSSGGPEGVVNTGMIEANIAELKAHGGNVYAMAIRNEGRVEARGVTRRGGQIFLGAPGGKIANSGTLKVESPPEDNSAIKIDAGSAPGAVENSGTINGGGGRLVLLGHQIELLSGSLVISDQGSIEIGSTDSLSVHLADGATVRASAGSVALAADSLMLDGVISTYGSENGGSITAVGREVMIQGTLDAGSEFNGGMVAVTATDSLSLGETGIVNADGGQNGGSIFLDAGEAGRGEIAGTITATGESGIGGTVKILGDELNFATTAIVDVSGGAGGGSIFAGGGRRGDDPAIRNSSNLSVAAGAEFAADATNSGNGGQVILFAEQKLDFNGRVSAVGGPLGGDGGFVELSGRESVTIPNLFDRVNLRAANGRGGELLIDPDNINILAGSDPSPSGITNPTNANTLYAQDISSFLNGQSLTIETTGTTNAAELGDITLFENAVISVASDNDLTLNASQDVIFRSGSQIDLAGQFDPGTTNLTINAGRDISFFAADVSVNEGEIDFNAGRGVSLTDSTIDVVSGSIAIDANPTVQAGNFVGIHLSNTEITGSLGTDITLTGIGGNDAGTSAHHGILIADDSSIRTADTGNITLTGTGGEGIDQNTGVTFTGTSAFTDNTIETDQGDIFIKGIGGTPATGSPSEGITISGSDIYFAALDNGAITLDGTASGMADAISIVGEVNPSLTSGGQVTLVSQNNDVSANAIISAGELVLSSTSDSTDFFLSPSGGSAIGTLTLGAASTDEIGSVTFVDQDDVTLQQVGTVSGNLDLTATEIRVTGDYTTQSGSLTFNGDVTLMGDTSFTTTSSGAGADFTVTGETMADSSLLIAPDLDVIAGIGNISTGALGTSTNPLGKITLDGQTLTIGALDVTGDTSLVSTADIVLNSGTFTAAGDFSATAGQDILSNGATFDFNGTTTSIYAFDAARRVDLVNVETALEGGALSIKGNKDETTMGDFQGVTLRGGTSISTTDASVSIMGNGGSDAIGSMLHGVNIDNSSITVGNAGTLEITGNSGVGTASNFGVRLDEAMVSTETGSLDITGISKAASTGLNNDGVSITGNSEVFAKSGGDLTITGTGGGADAGNSGILLLNASNIRAAGGAIDLIGIGGGGGSGSNNGIFFGDGTTVSSEGPSSGALSISGTSTALGQNSEAVSLRGNVTSVDGPIMVTGRSSGGLNEGIVLDGAAIIDAGTGNISLTGDGSSSALAIEQVAGSGRVDAGGTVNLISEGGAVTMSNAITATDLIFSQPSGDADFTVANSGNQVDSLTIGAASSDSFGNITLADQDTFSLIQNGLINGTLDVTATETIVNGSYGTASHAIHFTGDVTLAGDTSFSTNLSGSGGDFSVTGDVLTTAGLMTTSDLSVITGSGDIRVAGDLGSSSDSLTNITFNGENIAIAQSIFSEGLVDLDAADTITFEAGSNFDSTGGTITADAGNSVIATQTNLKTSGGDITLEAGRNVTITDSDITALLAPNSLEIVGNRNGGTTGNFVGVTITNSDITGSAAPIKVIGFGGNDGSMSGNAGVVIDSNSHFFTQDGGSLNIEGIGGEGIDNNAGVIIDNATLEADTADAITIVGTSTATSSTGVGNVGLSLTNGSSILGKGEISFMGTSATDDAVTSTGSIIDTVDAVTFETTGGNVSFSGELSAQRLVLSSPTGLQDFVIESTGDIAGAEIGGASTDQFSFVSITNPTTMAVQQVANLIEGNATFTAPEVVLDGNYSTTGTLSITGDTLLSGDTSITTDVGSSSAGDFAVTGDIGSELGLVTPSDLTVDTGTGDILIGGTLGITTPSRDQFLRNIDLTGDQILLNPTSGGIFATENVTLNVTATDGDTQLFIGEVDIGGLLDITTGAANDTVTFNSPSFNSLVVDPTINGGLGMDVVDFSEIIGSPISLSTTQLTSVESLIGSSSSRDRLIGTAARDSFIINGGNSGRIGRLNFTSIENLAGGNGNDLFTFLPGGDLVGVVDGQSGSDQIFIDNRTNSAGKDYTIFADAVIGSQYDFLNLENVRIAAGGGNDTFSTDFFPAFTQTLNGGGGTNTLTFRTVPDQRISTFTNSGGRNINASNFANFINLPPLPTTPPADGPDTPPTDPDGPDIDGLDTGDLLQLGAGQLMNFNQIGDDGNSTTDNFTSEGDENDLLLVDLNGDGIDDTTGFAADGAQRVGLSDRKPGQPFFVITPDGFVTFDMGAPPTLPIQQLLFGNVAPDAEIELRSALGGSAQAHIISEDGVVAFDFGAPPTQQTQRALDENLTPAAEIELRLALGGSGEVGVADRDGVVATDGTSDAPQPDTTNKLGDHVSVEARAELENALTN